MTAVFDADTKKFEAGAKAVASQVSNLTNQFGALTGGVSSATGALAAMTSPLALVVGGTVALTSAVSSAAVGVWKLAQSAAAAAGDLKDLSQQTGYSARTLSALSEVAKDTGGSIEAISKGLVKFEQNMVAAQNGQKEMSSLFKRLNIDTRDNEKALHDAFVALAKLPEGAQRTALSMQLFGRAGKEMNAIVVETNGNWDEAVKKYGLVSDAMANLADNFNDSLSEIERAWRRAQNSFAEQVLPAFINSFNTLNNEVLNNQSIWATWGELVAGAIDMAHGAFLGFVATVASGNLTSLIGNVWQQMKETSRTTEAIRQFAGGQADEDRIRRQGSQAIFGRSGGVGGGGSGGGGGGGRGGGGSARIDAGAQLLKQLESELKRLMPERVMWEQLMGKEYAKTADEVKKLIYVKDIEISQQKKINELTRERFAALVRLRTVMPPGLETQVRDRIATIEGLQRTTGTRDRRVFPTGAEGASRERIATVEQQVLREQYAMHLERIKQLANDLTGILDRAIYEGFEGGFKRGMLSLTMGILDLVKNVFLKQMADALSNMLNSASGGGAARGGLPWWAKAGLMVLGALGGSAGGASTGAATGGGISGAAGGAIGGFASGGYLTPGKWGVVGENGPELAFGGRNGMSIYPTGTAPGGGTVVNHYNIQLPPERAGSYNSPKARRQQARDVMSAIQGANS